MGNDASSTPHGVGSLRDWIMGGGIVVALLVATVGTEARVGALEGRLDRMEDRVDAVAYQASSTNAAGLAEIQGELRGIRERLERIERKVDEKRQ